MAMQLERAQEHALLRATGMTRAETFALVGLQAGLMVLIAGLLHHPFTHDRSDQDRRGRPPGLRPLLAGPGMGHQRPRAPLAGWDWLSLQLNNGADFMFYRLREHDGSTAPQSAGMLLSKRRYSTGAGRRRRHPESGPILDGP